MKLNKKNLRKIIIISGVSLLLGLKGLTYGYMGFEGISDYLDKYVPKSEKGICQILDTNDDKYYEKCVCVDKDGQIILDTNLYLKNAITYNKIGGPSIENIKNQINKLMPYSGYISGLPQNPRNYDFHFINLLKKFESKDFKYGK